MQLRSGTTGWSVRLVLAAANVAVLACAHSPPGPRPSAAINCLPGKACIGGRGTDAGDGLPIAGAIVTVTNTVSQTASTDSTGRYFVDGLAPGIYELDVRFIAHRPFILRGIRLDAGHGVAPDVYLVPDTTRGGG